MADQNANITALLELIEQIEKLISDLKNKKNILNALYDKVEMLYSGIDLPDEAQQQKGQLLQEIDAIKKDVSDVKSELLMLNIEQNNLFTGLYQPLLKYIERSADVPVTEEEGKQILAYICELIVELPSSALTNLQSYVAYNLEHRSQSWSDNMVKHHQSLLKLLDTMVFIKNSGADNDLIKYVFVNNHLLFDIDFNDLVDSIDSLQFFAFGQIKDTLKNILVVEFTAFLNQKEEHESNRRYMRLICVPYLKKLEAFHETVESYNKSMLEHLCYLFKSFTFEQLKTAQQVYHQFMRMIHDKYHTFLPDVQEVWHIMNDVLVIKLKIYHNINHTTLEEVTHILHKSCESPDQPHIMRTLEKLVSNQ